MAAKVVNGFNGNDLHALMEKLKPEKQRGGDTSFPEAMKAWEIGRSATRTILAGEVEKGTFVKIWGVLNSGKLGWVYRPVKGE